MTYYILVLAAAFLTPGVTCTMDNDLTYANGEARTEVPSANDSPIKIIINPEARVSVMLAGALPRQVPCGTPIVLGVKIINQGFVTARLEAELVDAPAGVALDFHPAALKGKPEEFRNLRITLAKPGATDITLAFRAHNMAPDLGGRNRLHFITGCK